MQQRDAKNQHPPHQRAMLLSEHTHKKRQRKGKKKDDNDDNNEFPSAKLNELAGMQRRPTHTLIKHTHSADLY